MDWASIRHRNVQPPRTLSRETSLLMARQGKHVILIVGHGLSTTLWKVVHSYKQHGDDWCLPSFIDFDARSCE